jgi:hypothetical protein
METTSIKPETVASNKPTTASTAPKQVSFAAETEKKDEA